LGDIDSGPPTDKEINAFCKRNRKLH
jgi:hypothetical protein